MKFIWIVSYSLVWLYVVVDAVGSVVYNVKNGYRIKDWFDSMSFFSYAWLFVNWVFVSILSFIMWLEG